MEKLLISACLAGDIVRYDGRRAPLENKWLETLRKNVTLIPFCPEVAGGMLVPRPPAEISGGNGAHVLSGGACVKDILGNDVSVYFIKGAESAFSAAKKHGVRVALLKEKSPSCGSRRIYNGSFNGTLINGMGVAAALLEANGIRIFGEDRMEALLAFIHFGGGHDE